MRMKISEKIHAIAAAVGNLHREVKWPVEKFRRLIQEQDDCIHAIHRRLEALEHPEKFKERLDAMLEELKELREERNLLEQQLTAAKILILKSEQASANMVQVRRVKKGAPLGDEGVPMETLTEEQGES